VSRPGATLVTPAPLVVLVGHPRPGSRTHGIAGRAGYLLRGALAAERVAFPAPSLVDLAELAPSLLDRHSRDGAAQVAVRTVREASLLLVASPTFKGAYSGLLKVFLDLLPRDGLDTTIVVPLMTAGLPQHRTAVEHTLRPVLLELSACLPTVGISVLEPELDRFDDVFAGWWSRHGPALGHAVLERTGSPGRRVADAGRGGSVAG
jgi:FMN reductase